MNALKCGESTWRSGSRSCGREEPRPRSFAISRNLRHGAQVVGNVDERKELDEECLLGNHDDHRSWR